MNQTRPGVIRVFRVLRGSVGLKKRDHKIHELHKNKPSIARATCSALIASVVCFSAMANLSLSFVAQQTRVNVNVDTSTPANRFIPAHALGAGVDGHEFGETQRQLSPANIKAMRSAGLKSLTYRLRTELAGEAWHWNPRGRWSEPAQRQGYWTSDSKATAPIRVSYGYRLPRRGNTIDQANDDGYSRIDDGDTATFWKSNPYLDDGTQASGLQQAGGVRTPQWVMIDLGAVKQINAVRILWAEPFAKSFAVQYGEFVGSEDLSQRLPTEWHTFPAGEVQMSRLTGVPIRLSPQPLPVRYLRFRLDESSETSARKSGDIRDRLGFAIREIYAGTLDDHSSFHDVIHHSANHQQTTIYVSSTDPWHRAIDRDRNTEQPGFDFIFRSGLTNGLPVLVPVPVLYDTPENGTAEIRYLTARHYPIDRVELGEEPDGQFIDAEHYAQLYLQFVDALRHVNNHLQFGGPSLQDIEQSQVPGRIEFGKGGWLGRFLQYLKTRDRVRDFSFFSFEWYPFADDCDRPGAQLQDAAELLTDSLNELRAGGLSSDIPWIISEYGYSAFGARAEIDLEGALTNADTVGRFLTLGGDTAYLYGYEPSQAIHETECSDGNNMMFFIDQSGRAGAPAATYWAARMLAEDWVKPGDDPQEIYAAHSDLHNPQNEEVVTAYPLRRSDGLWSVLLINKDPDRAHDATVTFNQTSPFVGPIEVVQFSSRQYQLNSDQAQPLPIKSGPPARFSIEPNSRLSLPAYSLTIVRGKVR